jgi:hypothetical protein
MGEIVFGAGLSHAPSIPNLKNWAEPEQASRFYGGLDSLREAFEKARPDVVVIMSNDHWNSFYVNNMPSICIGVANEHFGPIEKGFGIPQSWFPGHRSFAMDLMDEAMDSGLGVSFSEELLIDHGVGIPRHFVDSGLNVPTVPILVNALAPPLPRARQLYQLGAVIQRVAVARPKGERIAILGTGGLSHAPGEPGSGLNVEFDQWFLSGVEDGKGDQLAELTNQQFNVGGSGAQELKNWITVMGALSGLKAEILTYEPISTIGHGAAVWRV